LNDFPGHQPLKVYLKKIVREERVPHAMLISGKEGHGKLQLALGLATLLQCESPQEMSACKTCKSCLKMQKLIHPDVHFAFPVIKHEKFKREDTISTHFLEAWRSFILNQPWGNIQDWLSSIDGSDKRANINVAECNAIIKSLGLKSFEGKYKIQIIWESEMLGKEANRLLKLIEEPSPDTIIILICNNANLLLNTIRSRCQIINVPPFNDNDIEAYLKQNFDLPEEGLSEICFVANGNIRKATELASNMHINASERLLNWMRAAYTGDPEAIISWLDNMAQEGRQDLENFFNYVLHFFREYNLALTERSTDNLRLSNEEKTSILKMQKIIDRSKTEALQNRISESVIEIRRNLSIRILLMQLTLEMHKILRSEAHELVT
ncbi:MAG: hypothetical protein HKN09_14155, partial [Saprospiraceae bacterium]|nr:hypothetical protein [Saprospiraceae bacterium]